MAKFDHERAHMAANLVSDPPVGQKDRVKFEKEILTESNHQIVDLGGTTLE